MSNVIAFPTRPQVIPVAPSVDDYKAFVVRWVDVAGYKHRIVIRGVQDAGQARTAVGLYCEDFYEFLGDAEEIA